MMTYTKRFRFLLGMVILSTHVCAQEQQMDELWDGRSTQLMTDSAKGTLFRDGNYAMFIHWGLYSSIANNWKDTTYYGISEWIMNRQMANIPIDQYKSVASSFNPVNFNPREIVSLAKAAGMKYIIVTAKHHDGFSMFHSKANKFNIVDATPFGRDPMKELSAACREAGLGFGFYYSHNQDWTTPGGNGGPDTDEQGQRRTFDDYFYQKCLPEVEQLTNEYGAITLIWFDTPGEMDRKYVETLVGIVRRNQPQALVSGRAGHGLGDYTTFGDMEIPSVNVAGLWETVDVTNDSWGYAWYDTNWKSSRTILQNVISTVSRGGTYMLNVGPKPDGSLPAAAKLILENAGQWIQRNPDVIYAAEPSPWGAALPWGDAVVQGDDILVAIYKWPDEGKIYLPGMAKMKIDEITLRQGKTETPVRYALDAGWLVVDLPDKRPDPMVSILTLKVSDVHLIEQVKGIDPQCETVLPADFAAVVNCKKDKKSWMEKFGEWKHVEQVEGFTDSSYVRWDVEVCNSGYYLVSLNYSGEGRVVWKVVVDGDHSQKIQNQQAAVAKYVSYPMGWLKFDKPGSHQISVSLVEGNAATVSLHAISLKPVE